MKTWSTQTRHNHCVGTDDVLHRIFERVALEHPHKAAVVDEFGRATTYKALDDKAEVLCAELRKRGVRRNVLVGLCVERSADAIVGMLAILKAGGAYVPIDTLYPRNRIGLILRDGAIQIALATSRSQCLLEHLGVDVVLVDGVQAAKPLAHLTDENSADSTSTAYAIYTSGSSGAPKGVVVEHRNVCRLFVKHAPNLLGCGSNDVWLWYHSIGFDFSVWEIWGALLLGGTLVIASQETTRSPQATRDLVRRFNVTVLNQTPSAFRVFRDADLAANDACTSLRLIIFGGEMLDVELLKQWFAKYSDSQPVIVNMYGITETTIHVTMRQITARDLLVGGSPIGQPLPDLDIHLLNDQRQPVAEGQVGEIYVTGAGVSRGYANTDGLTRERFPTIVIDGVDQRAYRSGDLAWRNGKSDYWYAGRADEQIKLRGFRIEPSEVESTMLQCASISACAVKPIDHGNGDSRLVAFIVGARGAPLTDQQLVKMLKGHAAAHLPIYMRPSKYVLLNQMPLTLNGKTDRKALQVPVELAEEDYGEEGDQVTQCIVALWREVLGPEASLKEEFFDVGGTSLALTRLLSRISDVFHIHVNPRRLLNGITVAKLVQCINETISVTFNKEA